MRSKVAIILAGLTIATSASAVENGQSSGYVAFKIDGGSNFYLPPPGGFWLVNYTGAYFANKIAGPGGENVLPGAKLDVEWNTFGFKYLPNTGILGSTWTAFEIFPTIVRSHLSNGSQSNTVYGLADLAIDPFGLAWKLDNANIGFGTTFTVPIGSYDQNRPINPGNNRFSWNPQFYYNWFDSQGRGDVSFHAAYELNFTNEKGLVTYFNPNGSPYKSGQMIHAELAGTYNVAPTWSVAGSVVIGYQLNNDRIIGDDAANRYVQENLEGNRYKSVALGLSVRHIFAKSLPVTLTYTSDVFARNKAKGNTIVLKVVIPIPIL